MTEPLQFDAAEPAGTAAPLACSNCRTSITDSYHTLNQAVLCERCRRTLQREWESGSGAGRFGRALLFGVAGAILGALIYYAVLALTGYEVGLIAIVVGWLVGRAVKKGSGERGGRQYQALAVALTYVAIVSTYIPFVLRGAGQHVPFLVVFVVALQAPFLAGIQNIIGMLIIAFALYQAWIMNRKVVLSFGGPFKVGAPTT